MSEQTKQANLTRVQKVKALHEEKDRERQGNAQTLKAEYLRAADDVVLKDILAKAHSFVAYFEKLAKDGVGAKKVGEDVDGRDIIEDITFTPDQRLSNLDKASGIESLIAYIEGKLKVEMPAPVSAEAHESDAAEPDETETQAE